MPGRNHDARYSEMRPLFFCALTNQRGIKKHAAPHHERPKAQNQHGQARIAQVLLPASGKVEASKKSEQTNPGVGVGVGVVLDYSTLLLLSRHEG